MRPLQRLRRLLRRVANALPSLGLRLSLCPLHLPLPLLLARSRLYSYTFRVCFLRAYTHTHTHEGQHVTGICMRILLCVCYLMRMRMPRNFSTGFTTGLLLDLLPACRRARCIRTTYAYATSYVCVCYLLRMRYYLRVVARAADSLLLLL